MNICAALRRGSCVLFESFHRESPTHEAANMQTLQQSTEVHAANQHCGTHNKKCTGVRGITRAGTHLLAHAHAVPALQGLAM